MPPGEPGPKEAILDKLTWHRTGEKPSFHRFCQDISERFLLMPPETRLRDTTVQSVRLATAFLRPWFHKAVQEDFSHATSKLCELSFVIAQWPAQWWVRDHGGTWDLIRTTVNVLGEEVREKQRLQVSEEVQQLRDVICNLERVTKSRNTPTPTPSRRLRKKITQFLELHRLTSSSVKRRMSPSVLETASCIVTGFLLGTFISLGLLYQQRRSLTLHLT